MNLAFILGIALSLLIALSAWLYRRRPVSDSTDVDWIESFSIEKYQPMERLLDERDYKFLASQPGFDRSIVTNLRRGRREVLSRYLDELEKDFFRLHAIAVQLALASPTDRSHFATILARQKLVFEVSMMVIRAKLLLSRLGIGRVQGVAPLAILRDVFESAELLRGHGYYQAGGAV